MTDIMPPLRIEIDVLVKDKNALWSLAAEQGLGLLGMSIGDVLDRIGPREFPNIPECLKILVDPSRFKGCAITATTILPTESECALRTMIQAPVSSAA